MKCNDIKIFLNYISPGNIPADKIVLPVVVPRLCKEDITGIGHTALVYRVQAHHRHVEEHLSSVT